MVRLRVKTDTWLPFHLKVQRLTDAASSGNDIVWRYSKTLVSFFVANLSEIEDSIDKRPHFQTRARPIRKLRRKLATCF